MKTARKSLNDWLSASYPELGNNYTEVTKLITKSSRVKIINEYALYCKQK